MKTCACGKKIKNEYRTCFNCIDNHSVSSNEKEKYVKEEIPKTVRNALWWNYFKDSRVGLCACCRREQISISNFHASHIEAEKENGSTTLNNLAPCCPCCNLSMKTMNMNTFIKKYNLHYGLENPLNQNMEI